MTQPIFIHIPKTAGSTLRTLITENYEAHQVSSLYGDPKEILVAAAEQMAGKEKYRLIQGHIPYGTHRFLNVRNPRYFAFLRDHVTRFLSDVAHAVRRNDHGFHHILAEPGLSEDQRISKALDIRYYRNTMTHYMSGAFMTEDISMSQLGVAIDNLWNCEFIGLSEDFEASILIMAKKLGWQYVIPQKCNVRPDQGKPVSPELRARLDRALAYDRMLHAVAQEHLAENKKRHGPLLDDAASQLAELVRMQDTEHPDAQFSWHRVGQTLKVPLAQYRARIEKGSPLYRWLNE